MDRDSSSSKEFASSVTGTSPCQFWKLLVPWGVGLTLNPCSAPGQPGTDSPGQRLDRPPLAAGLGNRENTSGTRGTCAVLSQNEHSTAAAEEGFNAIHARSNSPGSLPTVPIGLLPLGCQFLCPSL